MPATRKRPIICQQTATKILETTHKRQTHKENGDRQDADKRSKSITNATARVANGLQLAQIPNLRKRRPILLDRSKRPQGSPKWEEPNKTIMRVILSGAATACRGRPELSGVQFDTEQLGRSNVSQHDMSQHGNTILLNKRINIIISLGGPQLADIGPNLLQVRPSLVDPGPNLVESSRCRDKFGYPEFSQIGSCSTHFGGIRQHFTEFARFGQTSSGIPKVCTTLAPERCLSDVACAKSARHAWKCCNISACCNSVVLSKSSMCARLAQPSR